MDTLPVTLDFSTALPIASYELSPADGQGTAFEGAGYDGEPQDPGVSPAAGQQQTGGAPVAGAGNKKRTQRAGANVGDPRFFAPNSSSAHFFAPTQPVTSGGANGRNDASQDSVARQLGTSLGYASQQDQDHYAYLLRLQDLTGISPAVSAGNEKEIQQWVDANRIDPEAFTINHPRTAGWGSDFDNAAATGVNDLIRIASMEQNGAAMNAITLDQGSNPEPAESLFHRMSDWWQQADFKGFGRDLHTFFGGMPWSPVEGMMTPTGEELTNAYDQGHAQFERGMLSIKDKRGIATADDLKRIAELDALRETYQAPHTVGGQLLGEAAEIAGSQLPMVPRSTAVGAAASPIGAAIGAAGLGVGALPGAISAFTYGFESEFAAQNYEMMAGNAYEDMKERGVDETRAQWAAGAVGAVNTALQLGITRIVGKPIAAPLTTAFDKAFGTELADSMTQPATAKVIQNAIAVWGKNTALGTGDMALQTIVDRAANDYADQKGFGGTASDLFSADFGHRLGKTLVNAAVTMGTINAATGTVGLSADMYREPKAGPSSPFFANFLQAIATQEDMKLPENAPGLHNDAMQTVLSGQLRMSRQAFNDYWIGQSMDPAAMETKLGVTFSVDAATGREYAEVPTANYFGKLATKDQKGLALYVIDPASKLTLGKYQALQQWAASGGPAKLHDVLPQSDPETAEDAEGTDESAEAHNAPDAQSGDSNQVGQTTEQQAQFYADQFAEKLEKDKVGAEEGYSRLKGTGGGRILSADDVRKLSEHYSKDKTIAPYLQGPATRFIAELFARKLGEKPAEGREPFVLFTAGGTGAGKSSALTTSEGRSLYSKADIIFDSTFSNFNRSDEKIQQTLASGRQVVIEYVYRDPVEAFTGGVLKRAMEEGEDGGRPIPLEAHLQTHVGARATVEKLRQKYAGDSRVKFIAVDNSRGEGNARVVPFDQLPPLKENGLRERLQDALKREFEAGRISQDVRGRTADTRRYGKAKDSSSAATANPEGRGEVRP